MRNRPLGRCLGHLGERCVHKQVWNTDGTVQGCGGCSRAGPRSHSPSSVQMHAEQATIRLSPTPPSSNLNQCRVSFSPVPVQTTLKCVVSEASPAATPARGAFGFSGIKKE